MKMLQLKVQFLEIKEETGLGVTLDAIIYDGVLRTNDEIALMLSSEDVLVTKKSDLF